ncbi:MAG: alpha/beta hydrolase [Leptospiraceae bacterium]|nr:alpha/beta hydrolase [Leptospiraceae bacterium]
MKKRILIISSIVALTILFNLFIAIEIFSRMILFPTWYHPGLTENCSSNVRAVTPEVCVSDPEKGLKIPFESISIPYKEGIVSGWFFPSPERSNRAMIFIHGAGSDRREGLKYIPFFHKMKISVYLYDGINHGLSFNDGKGVAYGEKEADSFRLIFQEANSKFSEIFLYTNSFGINSLAQTIELWKDKVSGLIIENPPYSLKKLVLANPIAKFLPNFYLNRVLNHTESKANIHMENLSPGEKAKDFPNIPILVLHGTEDRTVPLKHGKEFFDNLISNDKNFTTVNGAGHAMIYIQSKSEVEILIEKLLKNPDSKR